MSSSGAIIAANVPVCTHTRGARLKLHGNGFGRHAIKVERAQGESERTSGYNLKPATFLYLNV